MIKVTDRVWYYPFDDAKDRPVLGYIRGNSFSVAVDAGHPDDLLEYVGGLDEFTLVEYASGQPVKVVQADIVFEDSTLVEAGGVNVYS